MHRYPVIEALAMLQKNALQGSFTLPQARTELARTRLLPRG